MHSLQHSRIARILALYCLLGGFTFCAVSAQSLSGVTPERVGESYDLPLKEPPVLAIPSESKNLAPGKPVTTSFPDPILGSLGMITDGSKGVVNYADGKLRYIDEDNCYVDFSHLSYPGKVGEKAIPLGPRFVQIDLQESTLFDAIWIWLSCRTHGYDVVRKLVVQLSQDPDFAANVATIFNCDTDNSLGFGFGKDRPFATSRYGKLISIEPTLGRYVRIWSHGSVMFPEETRLVEVEIYGRPTRAIRQAQAPHRDHWFLLSSVIMTLSLGLIIIVRYANWKKNSHSSAAVDSNTEKPNKSWRTNRP